MPTIQFRHLEIMYVVDFTISPPTPKRYSVIKITPNIYTIQLPFTYTGSLDENQVFHDLGGNGKELIRAIGMGISQYIAKQD